MCGWVGRCRVSVRGCFFLDHGSGVVSILARAGWCVCVCWGREWGLGGMELWVVSTIMIFFFVHCCFSYSTCTLYFVCVYTQLGVIYVLLS